LFPHLPHDKECQASQPLPRDVRDCSNHLPPLRDCVGLVPLYRAQGRLPRSGCGKCPNTPGVPALCQHMVGRLQSLPTEGTSVVMRPTSFC
jgi:hypothetical protein